MAKCVYVQCIGFDLVFHTQPFALRGSQSSVLYYIHEIVNRWRLAVYLWQTQRHCGYSIAIYSNSVQHKIRCFGIYVFVIVACVICRKCVRRLDYLDKFQVKMKNG